METPFLHTSKLILSIMCLIMVITLIRYMKNFNTTNWDFLPIGLRGRKVESKYILLWTNPLDVPFVNMGTGRTGFISRKCAHTNCIVTDNKNMFSDIGKFDVVAFHGPEVIRMKNLELPSRRLPHQKYVFASIESAANYEICSDRFDGYFNWTWTYRLDSDVRWGYFVIKNSLGDVIGPRKIMDWIYPTEEDIISNEVKETLMNKTKAVAWFASNCVTKSRREGYVLGLQKYLRRYNLRVDIFGCCGPKICPREKEKECNELVERDYYFYLAFENSFSEDYVTEKVLIPLQNNAIPIVYGGADYTRFLPPKSYLNARELGIFELGDTINALIKNPKQYATYFRWKKHYTYHKTTESADTDEYCNMCALLNNDKKMAETSVYKNLQGWWDPPNAYCDI